MSERKQPPVAWAEPPKVVKLPRIEIVSPRPGAPECVICLSSSITGVVTHFLHQRTRPCTGNDDSCEGCQLGRPKRWKGYLAGETRPAGKLVLIEITYEGYRGCPELQGPDLAIYGKKIVLKRSGASRNSRVVVKVEPGEGKGFDHKPFNVEEALCRIWFGERGAVKLRQSHEFQATMDKLTHGFAPMPAD